MLVCHLVAAASKAANSRASKEVASKVDLPGAVEGRTSKPIKAAAYWEAFDRGFRLEAAVRRMNPPQEAVSRRDPAHSHFRALRADHVRAVAREASSLRSAPAG